MTDTSLLLDIDARGVANVTLNRPDVHNAFDSALIAQISALLVELARADTVRMVVLSGAGRSFCAGGDLNWMRAMKQYTPEENLADAGQLAGMFIALRRFPKPLIGVVHGVAFGGGSGLVALCDYVLAADDARFGFTEARLGLLPATISPFVIEKIGMSAARAHFISGAPFTAQEALRIGLVHKLVAKEDLPVARESVVRQFLESGPAACQLAKVLIDAVDTLIRQTHDATAPAVTEYTTAAIAEIRATEEAQEGMSAVLEGRKPGWISA